MKSNSDLCRFDNVGILWDPREKKYYHPSVVASIGCPNPEPLVEDEKGVRS